MKLFYTAELVTEGHPDKLCDLDCGAAGEHDSTMLKIRAKLYSFFGRLPALK